MPEHQIVINLKRDQFEEVQRLSRLAGANSVSAFIKDRVLSLLGVEGEAEEHSDLREPSIEEVQAISQELARMHRELQVFIAESLSSSNSDEADEEHTYFEGDLTEQAYEAYRSLQQAINEELYGSTTSGTIQDNPRNEETDIFTQISALNRTAAADANNAQTGVYANHSPDAIFLPQQNAYQPKANDELEDLAERAFAISPRLGTPATASAQSHGFRRPQQDDPLQDLIDDTIIEQAEKQRIAQQAAAPPPVDPYQGGMVYAFEEVRREQPVDVPSEDTRSNQTLSTGEQPTYQLPPDDLISKATQEEASTIESTPTDGDEQIETADNPDVSADETLDEAQEETVYTVYSPPIEDEEASTPNANDNTKSDEDNTPPPTTNSLPPDPYFLAGPPPKRKRPPDPEEEKQGDERISGGPPPKRRKK